MSDFLGTLLPMFLFMLLPVWIPVIAVGLGSIADRLRKPEPALLVRLETQRATPALATA